MIRQTLTLLTATGLLLGTLIGCENLPGTRTQQGAVIGGASGAAAGAVIAKDNRLLGALIGGALGAGGGYLIGTRMDKTDADEEDKQQARASVDEAQTSPATAADVQNSTTADLNNDGFVTTDELIAMDQAGLNDQEILNRLRATDQVFELTVEQKNYLVSKGVSRNVVDQLESINADKRDDAMQNSTIGRPSASTDTTR